MSFFRGSFALLGCLYCVWNLLFCVCENLMKSKFEMGVGHYL